MLILFLKLLLSSLALGTLLLCALLWVEIMASSSPQHQSTTTQASPQPHSHSHSHSLTSDHLRTTILIPAHNEALGIHTTLNQLKPQLGPKDQILVVADNCTDATATIAREAGVTVVERQDTQHRGKGYALDYGIGHLQNNPPDVVTIVDADCAVHPGSLATLAQAAHQHQRPVQSLYLMAKPPEPSLKDFVSAFAFKVKNLVRPAGLLRFNLPGPLAGTGMAFPWSILTTIDLAHGHIVEDMKLGLDLAIAGHPPLFCPQAQVTGALPSDDNASQSQRTRWEHGHLQLLFSYVPQLLYQGLVQRRFDLVAVALDLAIPPLSSLVLIWFVLTVVGGLFTTLTGFWFATLVLAIAGGLMVWAIAWAWYRYGRSDIPLGKLLGIPLYILWKIPLYFKFLFKPQTEWVRTKRDHSNDN